MSSRNPRPRIEADLAEVAGGVSESAIAAAANAGAALIELDVQMTSDGQLLLYHDYTLPGGDWVHETTVGECLRILMAAHPEHPNDLLRLDEAIRVAGTHGMGVALDLKTGMGEEHRLHHAVVPVVAEAIASGVEMHVSDWDHRGLQLVKAAAPHAITRGAIRGRLIDWSVIARTSGLDGLNLAWDCVRPGDVQLLHEAGVLVAFFGGWSDRFLSYARTAGADIVITDDWGASGA